MSDPLFLDHNKRAPDKTQSEVDAAEAMSLHVRRNHSTVNNRRCYSCLHAYLPIHFMTSGRVSSYTTKERGYLLRSPACVERFTFLQRWVDGKTYCLITDK